MRKDGDPIGDGDHGRIHSYYTLTSVPMQKYEK